MTVHLDDGDVRVLAGDCIEVMAAMPEESIDAIVCDPPYGLEFMGREWDAPWKGRAASHAEARKNRADEMADENKRRYIAASVNAYQAGAPFQAWCEEWATQALRVLKPGGHLVAFGGTRTFHRLTCGLEDAGFEIRDVLSWLYGSGFPKSLDVSKAIDKAAGAERQVVGVNEDYLRRKPNGMKTSGATAYGYSQHQQETDARITAPATDAAREWDGWGTALKPGWEPAVLARKPLTGTVARNVLEHGTGALNIDGCRIVMNDADRAVVDVRSGGGRNDTDDIYGPGLGRDEGERFSSHTAGRWPANVVLDESAAQQLDDQAGDLHHQDPRTRMNGQKSSVTGATAFTTGREPIAYADRGGPSRFFYTAKASTAERNNGHGPQNTHPTVKPVDLMRWLVRLITPPGGVVLDPFAGSGTTGVAARAEGFRAILIERDAEYLQIIAGRLAQQSLF